MKLKRYIYNKIYRSQQVAVQCSAKTKKRAAEIFGISKHEANNFVLDSEIPEDDTFLQKNPEVLFASFDSGLLFTNRRELIRKIMTFDEMTQLIDTVLTEKYV